MCLPTVSGSARFGPIVSDVGQSSPAVAWRRGSPIIPALEIVRAVRWRIPFDRPLSPIPASGGAQRSPLRSPPRGRYRARHPDIVPWLQGVAVVEGRHVRTLAAPAVAVRRGT